MADRPDYAEGYARVGEVFRRFETELMGMLDEQDKWTDRVSHHMHLSRDACEAHFRAAWTAAELGISGEKE